MKDEMLRQFLSRHWDLAVSIFHYILSPCGVLQREKPFYIYLCWRLLCISCCEGRVVCIWRRLIRHPPAVARHFFRSLGSILFFLLVSSLTGLSCVDKYILDVVECSNKLCIHLKALLSRIRFALHRVSLQMSRTGSCRLFVSATIFHRWGSVTIGAADIFHDVYKLMKCIV